MGRKLSSFMAVMLALAAVTGGVVLVDQHTQYETDPVEETAGALCGSLCIVGAGLAVGAATGYVVGQITDSGASEAELQKADATETKVEIYSRGSTLKQDQDILQTSLSNYLTDTESIARLEGKNAYIRALNNGSSESSARVAAKGAVADYYTVKQQTLIASWNTTIATAASMRNTSVNTTGVNSDFIGPHIDNTEEYNEAQTVGFNKSETITLSNGTSVATRALYYGSGEDTAGGDGDIDDWYYSKLGIDDGRSRIGSSTKGWDTDGLVIKAPTNNYQKLHLLNLSTFANRWGNIQTQNTDIQDEMDVFVNNTYDSYQQGEINNSDLIDPYLSARQYSPQDNTAIWTLRSLVSLGYSLPDNLSTFGNMTIRHDGNKETGLLLSDGLPVNDTFETGVTYDSSNLPGPQVFMDLSEGSSFELDGEFTVLSIRDENGTSIDSIKYQNISYNTTTTNEYQALLDDLNQTQAEINAYQQDLRDDDPFLGGIGGGGFLGGLFGGVPMWLLIVGGLILVLLLTRQ